MSLYHLVPARLVFGICVPWARFRGLEAEMFIGCENGAKGRRWGEAGGLKMKLTLFSISRSLVFTPSG